MSNATSDNRGRGEGQRRRRSRGGRSRNRNSQGGQSQNSAPRGDNRDGRSRQGGDRQGGNRQGGNRQGDDRQGSNRSRAPKPKPLTWWQKLLKAIGLYKEPVSPSRPDRGPVKSNTRNVRTEPAEREPKASKPRPRRERDEESRGPVSTADVSTKRIYLGNLSYEVTESDLEELFRGVGTVRRVEIVYNRQTHRSKGYGFVEMLDVDEAKRAVEILHDQFFMGRKLNVSGANSSGPADLEDTPKEVQPKAEEMVVESPKAEAPATEESPVEVTGDPEAAATEETGDATEEAPKATGQ